MVSIKIAANNKVGRSRAIVIQAWQMGILSIRIMIVGNYPERLKKDGDNTVTDVHNRCALGKCQWTDYSRPACANDRHSFLGRYETTTSAVNAARRVLG